MHGWKCLQFTAHFHSGECFLRPAQFSRLHIWRPNQLLRPDQPPRDAPDTHGLHFWVYDFRPDLIRPDSQGLTRTGSYFYCYIAAHVVVPDGHFAIASDSGLARASGLMVDRIVFPSAPSADDAFELALQRFDVPVCRARRYGQVILAQSGFFLPRLRMSVSPSGWWYHRERCSDSHWGELRRILHSAGIITKGKNHEARL